MNVSNFNTPCIVSHLTFCQMKNTPLFQFGLDHHTPTKSKGVAIGVEFEVLPRLIEKLNTYTGQIVKMVKSQIKKYL